MGKIRQVVEQEIPKSRYIESLNVFGMVDSRWELISAEEVASPELGAGAEPYIKILMSRTIDAPEKRPRGSSMKEILGLSDV